MMDTNVNLLLLRVVFTTLSMIRIIYSVQLSTEMTHFVIMLFIYIYCGTAQYTEDKTDKLNSHRYIIYLKICHIFHTFLRNTQGKIIWKITTIATCIQSY